ncbi:hypothetical protein C5D34_12810 [Rathayibacter sp. AY1B1]|uniref:hypothetical protein n=1 Tax=unclassified Rathayibacter TaxID=2609250 RepID=UPI000CE7FABE|nr:MULTISPECIES: hypothetical protein [unclassified Rathayibacter]PPI23972.1 hypothetical protein C5D08_03920 [Rathayibacter sp. AY1B6]PPI31087.1 hypothetical protein C5D34_12810 [Rathayibacter sp. AY1B1]
MTRRHSSHRSTTRGIAALAAITPALVLLGGCTSAPLDKDSTAHALLDSTTGRIVLPLEEYDYYGDDANAAIGNRALDTVTARCMAGQGFAYSAASVEEDPEHSGGDRTYGLWDEERARRWGFGFAPSRVSAAKAADAAAGGEAWTTAVGRCEEETDPALMAILPGNDESTDSSVSRIATEAYSAARADPLWQTARDAWASCVRDAGLTPRSGSSEWGVEQEDAVRTGADGASSNSEEEIRLATVEAHCNTETGLSQTLGDLEASYQAPLIAQNQAALNEIKTRNQERLAALRDYVAAHG